MKLTKEQAIREHRKMWHWIARETLKLKRKVSEQEYLLKFFEYEELISDYILCDYAKGEMEKGDHAYSCLCCPIDWGSKCKHSCVDFSKDGDCKGLYLRWWDSIDWQEAAALARQIAELPERKV